MKCEQCGKECQQTGANAHKICDRVYQTTRFYRCSKCGCEYKEVDNPVII